MKLIQNQIDRLPPLLRKINGGLFPAETSPRSQYFTAPVMERQANSDSVSLGTTTRSLPGKDANSENQRAQRKLKLLKRSGLFGEETPGITIRRASTVEELQEAYKLVHDVYTDKGYIYSEKSGMRLRIFEASPDTMTFVAKVNGRVVGVLSVVGEIPGFGLPSDVAFQSEIDQVRKPGLKLCEVTNQAVLEEYRKSAVPTALMRCGMAYTLKAGYDGAVAAVSPGHANFYQLLGFDEIGCERSYSDTIYDPVVMLKLDLNFYRQSSRDADEATEFVQHFMNWGNPYAKDVEATSADARRRFLSVSLLRQLFISEGAFIPNCTPKELHALERMWGGHIFSAVTGRTFWRATQNWVPALLNVLHLTEDVILPTPVGSAAH